MDRKIDVKDISSPVFKVGINLAGCNCICPDLTNSSNSEKFSPTSFLNAFLLILVSATSNTSMFPIDEIKVSTEKLEFKTIVDVPESLKNQIYNTTVERISYVTFDTDPEPVSPHVWSLLIRLSSDVFSPK